MPFSYYKVEPEILAIYSEPSSELREFFEDSVDKLDEVRWFTYVAHNSINGWLKTKSTLPIFEAISSSYAKLLKDYEDAASKGFEVEIRLCAYVEKSFGVSLVLCMKHPDAPTEYGWIMLEQVLIKRTKGKCSLWSYRDE